MIMPIDIEKKEFTRDKRGYNSREVDEFLDLISVDYEKVLNDNRNMAHKIKFLEKQLEESQKSDNAMLETLETAKRLMADISASAERRAELMMRDAELESENMMLEARSNIKRLNEEHIVLSNKVKNLRENFKRMLEAELASLNNDEANLLKDIDRGDIPQIEKEFGFSPAAPVQPAEKKDHDTLVVHDDAEEVAVIDPAKATVSDLSDSLKKMAEETASLDDTIILK